MEDFIEQITEYLEDQGIGTRGDDLFIEGFFGDGDNQIMVDHTGGVEPDRDIPIAYPTLQVSVRNTSYNEAQETMYEIFRLFHRKHEYALVDGGLSIQMSMAMSEPTHILHDEQDRHIFSCNFVFYVRREEE